MRGEEGTGKGRHPTTSAAADPWAQPPHTLPPQPVYPQSPLTSLHLATQTCAPHPPPLTPTPCRPNLWPPAPAHLAT